MNKFFAYIFGAGLGAGLMYYLDPQQGNRRQSLARDQVTAVRNDLDDFIQAGMRDLQNRVRGVVAETSSRFTQNQDTGDWVVAERARSRLGFLTSHPRAVEVNAQNGTLVLEGDVLSEDVDRLVGGLSKVRGVTNVDNRLRVHDQPGDVQTLQGESSMIMQGQWSPSTRLLAGVGSLYLLLRGRSGSLLSPLFTLGGLVLGTRTIVNRPVTQLFGSSQTRDLINVNKGIHIDAPVEDVFGLWSNFTEFPRFMQHVREIRDMGDGKSHWVVDGPAGVPVEFDTVITQMVPNELIAWQTINDSPVKHSGRVRFHEARGGTQVNVHLGYNPPAGVLGHAVAAFFGSDPKSEMDDDLMRLKALFETGTRPTHEETYQQENMRQNK